MSVHFLMTLLLLQMVGMLSRIQKTFGSTTQDARDLSALQIHEIYIKLRVQPNIVYRNGYDLKTVGNRKFDTSWPSGYANLFLGSMVLKTDVGWGVRNRKD